MLEFSVLCLERWQKGKSLAELLPLMDSVHLDIMDGKFVNNLAMSIDEVNRFETKLPKHVHLMVEKPEHYIPKLKGITSVSFHYETNRDMISMIDLIRQSSFQVGICLNPETPVSAIVPYLDLLDRVVVMAVYPGFSGQPFLRETTDKVRMIRELSHEIEIVVDGGMHEDTIYEVVHAGANQCVVCSVILKSDDYQEKTKMLRSSAKLAEAHLETI